MAERTYVSIVSGLPRSGTSLMMQMIDRGGLAALTDLLRTPDEDNPKGYYEFEPVKRTRQDPAWVKNAVGKVVKMTHLLLLDMPLQYDYRVVFMRRNLDEVIKSQNIMLERRGKETGDMPKERLTDLFRVQIHKVQRYMLDHADRFKLVEVDYNQIMRDPRPDVEKVSAFLDGLEVEKMLAVVDLSLYRNRIGN